MKYIPLLGLVLVACTGSRFSSDIFAGTDPLDSGDDGTGAVTPAEGGHGRSDADPQEPDAGAAGGSQGTSDAGDEAAAGSGGAPQGGAAGSAGMAGSYPTGGTTGLGGSSGGGTTGLPDAGAAGSYLGGAGGEAGSGTGGTGTGCFCVSDGASYSLYCGGLTTPCEHWCSAGACMGECGPSELRCEGSVAKWCSGGEWIDWCPLSGDPSNHEPCCP